jgi:hypothetical protein
MNLIDMAPHDELSSTRYVLANPGQEYLVLQPHLSAEPFSITVAPGIYEVEWFNVTTRETLAADDVEIEGLAARRMIAPFDGSGPVVLYLKRRFSEGVT